jgi:hypothetical protein
MNYGLHFSNRVEDELVRLVDEKFGGEKDDTAERVLTRDEENELYQQAFNMVLVSDEGRTKAAGNVRIGEYILLIDSDTRVVCSLLSIAYSLVRQLTEDPARELPPHGGS